MQNSQRYNYSLYKPSIMKDRERAARIADRIVTILEERMGDLSQLRCLDICCSAGLITGYYAGHFRKVLGIDVDRDAIGLARKSFSLANLEFQRADVMEVNFEPESFDVIVGIGIYEYVPDARKLFRIISRLLKKGGICYLQARNRFSIIEQETGLFMINLLPRRFARFYAGVFKKDKVYYEKTLFLKGLRRLVTDFEVSDYTLKAIREPRRYHLFDSLGDNSLLAKSLAAAARVFYFAIPNYMWVLEKR